MELDVVIRKKSSGQFWTGTVKCKALMKHKKKQVRKFGSLAFIKGRPIVNRNDYHLIGDETDLSLYVSLDEFCAMYEHSVRPFALIKIKRGLGARNLWINVATSSFK